MRDRFKTSKDQQRMHRLGSEQVDGGMPRELQPPPRPHQSKDALREMLARAVANTAAIKVLQVQPNKAKR